MSKDAAQVRSSKCREIPPRRVILSDPSQIPSDYSSTPGGTIFSTTPGGTRIIYERNFLMQMRNSPLAKTPPKNLPTIPGVTSPAEHHTRKPKHEKNKHPNHPPHPHPHPNPNPHPHQENHDKDKPMDLDEPQFEMDI